MQVIVERDAESNDRQRKLGRCEWSQDQVHATETINDLNLDG